MNKQLIIIISIVALVGIGFFASQAGSGNKATMQSNVPTNTPVTNEGSANETVTPDEGAKSFTLTEVSTHSKAEDCWMAIEGNVYDVTPYIQKQIHPGGAAILFGCGKDSTAIFNLRPKDNKPHSQNARNMLEKYFIGTLAQ